MTGLCKNCGKKLRADNKSGYCNALPCIYANKRDPAHHQAYREHENAYRRNKTATDRDYAARVSARQRAYYRRHREKCLAYNKKKYREGKYWLRPYKRNYQHRYFQEVYWIYRNRGGKIGPQGRDYELERQLNGYVVTDWFKERWAGKDAIFVPIRINKGWYRRYGWMKQEWYGYWKNIYAHIEESELQAFMERNKNLRIVTQRGELKVMDKQRGVLP